MKKRISLIYIVTLFLYLNSFNAQSPVKIVKQVADKIINETTFEFSPKLQEKGNTFQIVDVPDSEPNKILYARSIVCSDKDINITFGISSTKPIDIWINGKSVFSSNEHLGQFETVAYDMYKFPVVLNTELNEGDNSILVKTYSGRNEYFALAAIDEHGMLNESVHFNLPVLDQLSSSSRKDYHKWLFLGPLDDNSNLKIDVENIQQFYPSNQNFYSWYISGTKILLDDVIKDNFSFTKHSYFEWHYANGQMLLGMLNLADWSGDQKYSQHVKKFCDFTLDNFDYFKYQYKVLNERNGFNHRLFRRIMLDDTGAPALPFIELNLRGKLDNAKLLIDTIAAYVYEGQKRLPDGTLCRPEPREWTVWADDLFMSVPFLLRYAKLTGEEKYYDDAAKQILLFHNKLFDFESNLYYHGWFSDTKETSVAHWGRANGWVIWAVSEALFYLPEDHPKYEHILNIYRSHVNGLIVHQSDSGMWHQIIDKPESYEETSSSAMFTLAIARGVQHGWLDESFKKAAFKGWKGIARKIDKDDTVFGICRGTGIGFDLDFYYKRETPHNDPRGLGAVLTAGIEIAKLLNESGK